MALFRRRNGQMKPIAMDSDVDGFTDGPVTPQVAQEGGELFEDFMTSQIDKDLPQLHELAVERYRGAPKPRKGDISQAATRLRKLATNFAKSDERQQVREIAMEVSPEISGEELSYLLITMFTNSEHVEEGIVVIFFFCFDLVARLVTSGLKTYWDILTLCKVAIIKALGPKIQERGGWSQSIVAATENNLIMGVMATGMLVVARVGLNALFNL